MQPNIVRAPVPAPATPIQSPHPGGVVIEASPMVSATPGPAIVTSITPTVLPGTLVSMPQPAPMFRPPAMHYSYTPIMTGAVPMPAAVPPLPIGGMRAPVGIPQGKLI